jgi:hypothetical protein
MESMYYIGLDVHKRKISYCVKDGSGKRFSSIKKAVSYSRRPCGSRGCVRTLRIIWCGKEQWQHDAAHATVEAAQQASANHADRSGQDGSALQPDAGAAL